MAPLLLCRNMLYHHLNSKITYFTCIEHRIVWCHKVEIVTKFISQNGICQFRRSRDLGRRNEWDIVNNILLASGTTTMVTVRPQSVTVEMHQYRAYNVISETLYVKNANVAPFRRK